MEEHKKPDSFGELLEEARQESNGRFEKNLTLALLVTSYMQRAYCTGRWLQAGKDPEKANWSVVQWEAKTPEEFEAATIETNKAQAEGQFEKLCQETIVGDKVMKLLVALMGDR